MEADATGRMDLSIRVVSQRRVGAIFELVRSSVSSHARSERGRFSFTSGSASILGSIACGGAVAMLGDSVVNPCVAAI